MSGIYTGKMIVPHYAPVDAPEGAFCNIEKDRMENTPDFFDLNLKLNYTFVLHDHIKLQLNAGVQNIFNSFQKTWIKGSSATPVTSMDLHSRERSLLVLRL